MKNYSRTDLACECDITNEEFMSGNEYSVEETEFCSVARLHIKSEKSAKALGKPIGRYITFECGRIWDFYQDQEDKISELLANEIRALAESVCCCSADDNFSVLIVGLGNENITADALGPETVRKITVSRHISVFDPDTFKLMRMCRISAISPGVVGQTGIETLELIKGACKSAQPKLVIAIDALAARSCERLATTIQLSDSGIQPGGGIGNARKAISHQTLGIPVISIGVPTVVSSSTLVYDALQKAGIEDVSEELYNVLENGNNFFVSPKESDELIKEGSLLLSRSLGQAFSFS